MNTDEVTLAYADRDAALERLGAVLAERDQLARLHEVATERVVGYAAVIEQAHAELTSDHDFALSVAAMILHKADTDAALREVRAKALEDARVRPEFTEYMPNDGEYEYASASDCDGSNVHYWRRRPRHVGDYFPWEPTTEEQHAAALGEGAKTDG